MIIFFHTADDSASKILNGLQFSNILICGIYTIARIINRLFSSWNLRMLLQIEAKAVKNASSSTLL